MNRDRSKNLPKPGGLSQVGIAGPASYTEVGSRVYFFEKGWRAKLLFVFMKLSHKHPLVTGILIQDVVFILGVNQ